MAGPSRKDKSNRNPWLEQKQDAARAELKKDRGQSKVSESDQRIERFLRNKEEAERRSREQERKRRREQSRQRRADRPAPSQSGEVEVRKVQPRQKKAENLLVPEGKRPKSEPKVLGSNRRVERKSQSVEFVPKHLRDAVRGEDGLLRTTKGPKGFPWER